MRKWLSKLFDRIFLPAHTRELKRQNEILERFNQIMEEDGIYEASRYLLINTDDSWGGMTSVLRDIAKRKLTEGPPKEVN